MILPVELSERPRVIEWDPTDHDEAEALLRAEIGCAAIQPWVVSGVGMWHDATTGPIQAFNPRASWFTHVAEEPCALTGTCVLLQACCVNGLTQAWVDIALQSIATMPDPWDVALRLGLGLGRDS